MSIKTSEEIKNLFDIIAPNYDFMNNIISFFTHKKVRKFALKVLKIKPNSKVLDLCCGSGDFGGEIKNSEVIGIDFSQNMLDIAKEKYPDIKYFKQDATDLKIFPNETFDYVIMGFGLRNINNKDKAISEINRVLKNNGYFLHLDFGKKTIFNQIYNKIVLFIIKFFIKNTSPYKYLVESKNQFYSPKELIEKFSTHNFQLIKRKDLIFGIISFQIMQKI